MGKNAGPVCVTRQQAEKQWQYEGVTVLQASLSLPDTKTPGSAGRRFRRYYRLYARSFFRYCQMELFPQALQIYRRCREQQQPFSPLQAQLRTTVTLQNERLLSLYTDLEENTDGPSFCIRRSDGWDLTRGYPLTLFQLFPGVKKRDLILQLRQQAQLREKAGVSCWREGWRQNLRRYFSPANFYLTGQELCFFYPMYALGGPGEGIPVFSLPMPERGLPAFLSVTAAEPDHT